MGYIYVRGKKRELDNTGPVDLVIPEWNVTILDTKLGEGVVIWSNLNVYGANIGENVKLASFVEIQDGVQIGENSKIQTFVCVVRGVTLGKGVFVGPHAVFTNDNYPRTTTPDGRRSDNFELAETVVEDYASIGAAAVILAGVKIGSRALIGAGSVVADDVGEGEIWYGGKARKQRTRN
ncbi:MAG: acyltransferase [Gemmatimonadales bacterium]